MGLGGLIFAGAALVGLHVVLANVPSVYLGLKIIGAMYLFYLAARLWRGAKTSVTTSDGPLDRISSRRRSFVIGLATQLSNPKTAIVYASFFTALLPADLPEWLAAVVLPSVFAVETMWYTIVAIAFSSGSLRSGYLRSKLWIDRSAAGVMGLLALKLISDAK